MFLKFRKSTKFRKPKMIFLKRRKVKKWKFDFEGLKLDWDFLGRFGLWKHVSYVVFSAEFKNMEKILNLHCSFRLLHSWHFAIRLQLHYALCEQFFKAQSFVYSPQIQSILICACFWNFENPPNFENPKWFFWKHEKSKSENSILRG